ncbi:hypothetical protein GW17_00012701 [Ensete ventricosum]|nr:hypothetical protein GW17_00012701 [Ensete ventricosum]
MNMGSVLQVSSDAEDVFMEIGYGKAPVVAPVPAPPAPRIIKDTKGEKLLSLGSATCALEPVSPAAASASACRRAPTATRSCAASATPTGRRTGTGPSAPERRPPAAAALAFLSATNKLEDHSVLLALF